MPSLQSLVESGTIKFGDYISYVPDIRRCKVSSKLSGFEKDKVISTDVRACYFFWGVNPKNGEILLAANKSVNSISLVGNKGLFNGSQLLNMVCERCYGNHSLHAKARSFTAEDLFSRFHDGPIKEPKRFCFARRWELRPGSEVDHNGHSYKVIEISDKDPTYKFLLTNDGGVRHKADFGFEYRTVEYGNPIFVSNNNLLIQIEDKDILLGDDYWLATQYINYHIVKINIWGAEYGLHFAQKSEISFTQLGAPTSDDKVFGGAHGIRPMIELNPTLQVEEFKLPKISFDRKVWIFTT